MVYLFQLIIDFFMNSTSTGEPLSYSHVIFLWSLTNAVFIPGGMIGAFLGGLLADKWGRLVISSIHDLSGTSGTLH